ncbi:hypothetical protein HZS_2557 [Henneguya salminicola]|nr:hypothetical protein HZS_2557 [Henneguya salminicola]
MVKCSRASFFRVKIPSYWMSILYRLLYIASFTLLDCIRLHKQHNNVRINLPTRALEQDANISYLEPNFCKAISGMYN